MIKPVRDGCGYAPAMSTGDAHPQVFGNRFADAVGPGPHGSDRDRCRCVGHSVETRPATVAFHGEQQDLTATGWLHLQALIEEAATDERTEFKPFVELAAEERRQIITLPPTIAKLTSVRRLVLYGTNLVRIPPEIGAMISLENFQPYTSHRLHWYPYELTRCQRLKDSTVSTRVLYGNFKFRPPFPALRPVTEAHDADFAALDPHTWGTEAVRTCSVCDGPVDRELRQAWISLRAGTDALPLLVNACSAACIAALPQPHDGYIPAPHTGGPHIVQPPSRW
jgi:hypothetical protein